MAMFLACMYRNEARYEREKENILVVLVCGLDQFASKMIVGEDTFIYYNTTKQVQKKSGLRAGVNEDLRCV